jgi:hypothetical protein
MEGKRIRVWVQHFADRPYLMLQWHDSETGKRKSKSAETNNPAAAEDKRADLAADLNAGRYQEAARMTWEKFRELFLAEFAAGRRANTRRHYLVMFNRFQQVCNPTTLRAIS